jgi:hypothetical protein
MKPFQIPICLFGIIILALQCGFPTLPDTKQDFIYLSDLMPDAVSKNFAFSNRLSGAPDEPHPFKLGGQVYDKGICLFPPHFVPLTVEYTLNGNYTRLETFCGINDAQPAGEAEWGSVNPQTHEFIEWLGGSFKGHERSDGKRDILLIGGGASVVFYADNKEICTSGVFYPGEIKPVTINLKGIKKLKIVVSNDHEEKPDALYRDKKPQGIHFPYMVKGCNWYDEVNLAEPKLFKSQN